MENGRQKRPGRAPEGDGDAARPGGDGLSYRARRRLSLLVLAVGLPVYIVVAVNVVEMFGRPGILAELAIYAVLGVLWALPLRAVFRGVGRADPGDRDG